MQRVKRPHLLALAAILMLTTALYAQVIGFDFVLLDDPMLVSENPLIAEPSLSSAWTAVTSYDPELYVPLTTLTYLLESALLGMQPWHFHLVNMLLHLACVCCVFAFVRRITSSMTQAAIVATLFAVHPINTETVAWVSARKDLLSTFFSLSSILLYLGYREQGKRTTLAGCLLLFLLALLSKGTALMLPGILLLIDWKQKRSDRRSVVLEKIPFFALSILFFIIALMGKSVLVAHASVTDMALMAFRSTVLYVQLIFFPLHQSAIYLYERSVSITTPDIAASAIVVVALTAMALRFRSRYPAILFGWMWFILWLLPTYFHYSHDGVSVFVASDRYAYVAAIGIFLALASAIDALLQRLATSRSRRAALWVAMACITVLLCSLTLHRTRVWANGFTLSHDVLSQYPSEYHSRYNLALAYERRGQVENALREYRATITLRPQYVNAYVNLGALIAAQGDIASAIDIFMEGTRVRPDAPQLHYNLGLAYQHLSRWDEAIASYKRAIAIESMYREAYRNLATVYGEKKMYEEAVEAYASLASIDPSFAEELKGMGITVRRK